MECPYCQREMITGASACHHCGKRLPVTLRDWLSRLGTVLLLPVIMFKRAYSLHYLAQYGPAYNVFQSTVTP